MNTLPRNRAKGSPMTKHWFGWMPPEGEAWVRVIILFEALLAEEGLPKNVAVEFDRIAQSWASTWPEIGPETWDLARPFINTYFKVDNPVILPVLLDHWYHMAIQWEASTEAATRRLTALASDPSPLGWPNTKSARNRFSQLQESNRAKGYVRKDIGSIYRYAEAWVRVRHDLERNLKDFVARQKVRAWEKSDGEEPDFDNRYRNWRREMRKFDKAVAAPKMMHSIS